jgi:hypothetical protein
MTHFYKVIRGRVLHNNKTVNIGEFIYANPQEMEGVTGVGSVMRVEKGEVSFAFLQENNLLPSTNPVVVQVQQEQAPVITTQILTPVISQPVVPPETPTPPETPELTVGNSAQTDLGVSLGIDPAAKAEATGKRNRSAAPSNQ